MKNHRGFLMAFVVAVVGFLFVVPFCGAAVMYEQVFGKRTKISDSPLLPKFEDFSDMDRRQVRFPSNRGQMLTGYVYSAREGGDTNPKGLVVLSHGLGGGHSSYLYEIDYFVGQGYDVFAYDNTGCYESEGEDMVGLVQSCIDLDLGKEIWQRCRKLSADDISAYSNLYRLAEQREAFQITTTGSFASYPDPALS